MYHHCCSLTIKVERGDLGQYSVLCCAQEGLDLEVLLDPLEEQLDLPTVLIDVGDRLCAEIKTVGQENIVLAAFGIAITDAARTDRTLRTGSNTRELDRLIAGQSLIAAHRSAFYDAVLGL